MALRHIPRLMSATLHLHPIPDPALAPDPSSKLDAIFLVVQRSNGHWSPAAKILSIHETEPVAEAIAALSRLKSPQQTFGVFKLRSEARPVAMPIEMIRATDDESP